MLYPVNDNMHTSQPIYIIYLKKDLGKFGQIDF